MENIYSEYERRTKNSKRVFERARKVMAGGISHNIRYFSPYPFYVKKAKGSRVWDIDDNEYIDFWMGHYARILGYAPRIIADELKNVIFEETHLGFVNEYEVEFAELICEVVPSAEKVRFCCSGTEATMYAVRMARAFTGKNVILKIDGGWHGANTELSFAIHKSYKEDESAGIIPEIKKYTKVIPFNDIENSVRIIRENKDDLAAILMEPVVGAEFIPADLEYLKVLREETQKIGALLIFDEIITGFRIALGGAQEKFGVIPDLTTLGKIAGGGMPIGVVVGKKRIIDLCDPTAENTDKLVLTGGGTFSCNPLAMVAGIKMVSYLRENKDKIYPQLNQKGNKIRKELERVFNSYGISVRCNGCGSLFRICFPVKKEIKVKNPKDVRDFTDVEKREEFNLRMVNKGVHLMRGGGAVSLAHTDKDIEKTIQVATEVAEEMVKKVNFLN